MTQAGRRVRLLASVLAALAVGCSSRGRSPGGNAGRTIVEASPRAVMGTECVLKAVVPADRVGEARAALKRAEQALRRLEAVMSVHLADSALSRFNAAPARREIRLPAELTDLLRRAASFTELSGGAFDVTCGPVVRLWKRCAKAGRQPSEEELRQATARVGMKHLSITERGVTKLVAGVFVDLGAIAKGCGVDRAVEVLRGSPAVVGAMVNVGGDLRCFGTKPDGGSWRVGVQHPFREALCGALVLRDAAVATSGDYRRFVVIAGRRYSHIVDPRTGRPVEATHSVTVVSLPTAGKAPSATDADAWATTLSVMGPKGLALLEGRSDLEALIITGTPARPEVHMTDGFRRLLAPGTGINLE